jgi:hypothetical protein
MSNNTNTQFDALFYKVATNLFSLEYLEEVQSFYPKYLGKDDFDEIKFECENLISAIYFMNGMSDRSLEIDLDILKKHPIEDLRYRTVILRASKTSAELGKTEDVVSYAVRYLKDQENDFFGKLPLLAWYIEFYPNGEEGSFINFEQTLATIKSSMGATINPTLSFLDRVTFLYEEFLRANKDSSTFKFAYVKATKEQKDKLLEEYLRAETLAFFRTEIINTIKTSESINGD